jgi:predicted component of type VI protein secretion system
MEHRFENVQRSWLALDRLGADSDPLQPNDGGSLVPAVWLRLVRGASEEPVWMLRSASADGIISVGAAETCDWQIQADRVPPLAFYLRALAGSLFVRACGAGEVRVDGHALGSIWVPVAQGARLRVGEALIEVGLSGRSRAAQHETLCRTLTPPVELADDAFGDCALLWQASEAIRQPASNDFDDVSVCDVLSTSSEPVSSEPVSSEPVSSEPVSSAVVSSEPVPSAVVNLRTPPPADAAREFWTATIFGPEEISLDDFERDLRAGSRLDPWHSTRLWIAGSLLACAYGCWVLLLDYF